MTLTISNSTISGNSAPQVGGILNAGGAGVATLTIKNTTLSGNSGSVAGGIGNTNNGSSATVTIGSTILNAGALGENIVNLGTFTSLGFNLSSDNGAGLLTATGDQINTDPQLAPLAYNGGPTPIHTQIPLSPAQDAGKNFSGATTDQRGPGFPRSLNSPTIVGGDGTDIGSFERRNDDFAPTLCRDNNRRLKHEQYLQHHRSLQSARRDQCRQRQRAR